VLSRGYQLSSSSNYCGSSGDGEEKSSGWSFLQTCNMVGSTCALTSASLPANAASVGSCGAVSAWALCSITCASGFTVSPSFRWCTPWGFWGTQTCTCRCTSEQPECWCCRGCLILMLCISAYVCLRALFQPLPVQESLVVRSLTSSYCERHRGQSA
jgi:hypothetical protein